MSIVDLMALRELGGRATGLVVSPDGAAIAYATRHMDAAANRHVIEWFVVPAEGGIPVSLGDGGELITYVHPDGRDNGHPADPVAHWSPDGAWLAYLRRSGGETQVWRSSRDGRTQAQVTHAAGDVKDFAWSSDSKRIQYRTGAARAEIAKAERQDLEAGFRWDETFWPARYRRPLRANPTLEQVWVADTITGGERPATPEDQSTYERRESRTAGGADPAIRRVFALPGNRWTATLHALDPARQGVRPPLTLAVSSGEHGNSRIFCPAAACTGQITSVFGESGADRLYFLRREGHGSSRTSIYEWDIGSPQVRTVYSSDDWLGDDCAALEGHLVCFHESPIRPRRIVAIDPRSGTVEPLVDVNPDLLTVRFGPVEKLEWTDRFGNQTFGHLVYPAEYQAGKRFPLVVVQYESRGFLRGGTGGEYPIHALSARGFFVLSWDRPHFRAMAEHLSEEELFRFVYAERREHLSKQSALERVLRHLAARGLIDPGRVGLTGLSDGAETVRYALMHSKLARAAAVSQLSGDPCGYYLHSANVRRLLNLPEPGSSENAREVWELLSVRHNVDRIGAPILLNVSESEMLAAAPAITALSKAGKAFDAYVYPGAFHIKNRPSHLLRIMTRNVDWFDFWLRDTEDISDDKALQYQHWRRLRGDPSGGSTGIGLP